MTSSKKYLFLILSFALITNVVSGQSFMHEPSDFRGDPNLRRHSNVDGNNIRATLFNSGYSGKPDNIPEYIAYEWPKNTNRIYISIIGAWLGGEVKNENDEITHLVEMPLWRSDPNGNSWNIEPVPGFSNPLSEEIARSDDENSWPTAAQGGWADKREDYLDEGWVGSWNGFFGKDIFNADQEFYYLTSDDAYDKFDYVPDTTDYSRAGLGLLMDVRTMAWSQVLINDVVFSIHDIKNDGTKVIDKAAFLIFLADYVGGDGTDDFPFVDLQTDIAFLTDNDRIGVEAFGTDPVGVAAIKYIETPGNQVDGIDNDGDSDKDISLHDLLSADPDSVIPHFEEEDFLARTLLPRDKIVLIEPVTYNRSVVEYPQNGGTVYSLGKEYQLPAGGTTLFEDSTANAYDDDLDGLIDENRSLHLLRYDEISGTERAVRFINYLNFDIGDIIKRGFAVAGLDAELSFENVAPMVDESRDDLFDNDNDWDSILDDNGLDGNRNSGDEGERDGKPTSGAGTNFPGEPGIDKTDVSETDLVGITSVVQIPVGQINYSRVSDDYIWNEFMAPGNIELVRQLGEFDTFVSSGFFPILPGERQRMAVSVSISGGGINTNADIASSIEKQRQAELAYNADYQFARAPLQVTLTAVPGDGKVTLYWDDEAEKSFDRYIDRIGGNGADFEGYKIYRATDAAFLDAKVVTDAYGVQTLLKPITWFDKNDGISGLHPIDINGVKYFLGNDNGLRHEFVDTDVLNGQTYYYAVTAYDFGYEAARIPPSESNIRVDVDLQGNLKLGTNVVRVRPTAASAGYFPPEVASFEHYNGGASGQIFLQIYDNTELRENEEYELTFKDTTIVNAQEEILTTKSYSVQNLSTGQFIIEDDRNISDNAARRVFDGFKILMTNVEKVELNKTKSGWNSSDVYNFNFEKVVFLSVKGTQRPNDYKIIFDEVGFETSHDTSLGFLRLPAKDVNFKIYNATENRFVKFAFSEADGNDGKYSINPTNSNLVDAIYFLEPNKAGKLDYTWQVVLNKQTGSRNPQAGDSLNIILNKPFLSSDVYRFQFKNSKIIKDNAETELDDIRVVPNPYVAAEIWEPRNTYTSGRGPREIHFINLPNSCTIRIYNVNGVLIDTIIHDGINENGTAIWDVLSSENFEIAYGLYIYHVDAPGIGEKSGTFAIIK
ncbi:MAG: hypothetical protein K9J12_03665 [Melioribacteraceae bacterium]|nr:hypothetical protein [Melioribacteraceae bacterium]MCF8263197.1 hypothetical protein [Melioribacteraceae bacterium]MCF8431285.1 hypothetical protein [Melioribacteraceae bacterium]